MLQSRVQIKDCIFKRNLAKGAHFIDGRSNLQINDCKFAADQESAIRMQLINKDANQKEFYSSNSFDNGKYQLKVLVEISIMALMAILVIVVVSIIFINHIKSNDEDENSKELQGSLI